MTIATNLEKTQVAQLYEQMVLIRRFEESSSRLYMQGRIRGFCHLYIGQEAIAVGAMSVLRDDDYVITHYRDHGHALARGIDPNLIMAELMGKATGTSGGKGGSMHIFDVSKGFMGGHAIVGGQLPIAVGLALAIKYRGEDRAVVCFFGDGAVNEGEFHESMNLASLWKLPVLFFLENNLYGMGTHVERTRAGGRDIYRALDAYMIPAVQIDGMNVLKVRAATEDALERIRSGVGPVFVEGMTYRFVGHSVQDPSLYRDSTEVDDWKRKDPIDAFRTLSLEAGPTARDDLERQGAEETGLMTQEDFERIDAEVEARVQEAVRFAEESPDPDLETLYENVYA